jgi:hypothetical protein
MTTAENLESQLTEAAKKLRRNDTKLAAKIEVLAKHKTGQSRNRKAQQIIVLQMLKGRKFKMADIKPWFEGDNTPIGFAIWNLVNRELVKVVEPGTYQVNRRSR